MHSNLSQSQNQFEFWIRDENIIVTCNGFTLPLYGFPCPLLTWIMCMLKVLPLGLWGMPCLFVCLVNWSSWIYSVYNCKYVLRSMWLPANKVNLILSYLIYMYGFDDVVSYTNKYHDCHCIYESVNPNLPCCFHVLL